MRWFTPGGEIDLCGHATLAAAYILMNEIDKYTDKVTFSTLSGDLTVKKSKDIFEMDFPIFDLKPVIITKEITQAIGAKPKEVYIGRDLICIFEDEETIKSLNPNMELVKKLDGLLLQVSAKGKNYDCVSRTFAPKMGVEEDPVCGSGHCHIVPYWAKKLNKNEIIAFQASKRTGVLHCKLLDNRVLIGGHAVIYSISDLKIV